VFEVLFVHNRPSLPASRIPDLEQWHAPSCVERIGAVVRLPPLITRSEAEGLGWSDVQ